MTYAVVDLSCPGCGGSVNTSQKTCKYCGRDIVITSFSSVYSMLPQDINKYVSSYRRALTQDPDNSAINLSIAMCYLKQKLYRQALTNFEKAIEDNFDNSETYFYAAVSLLQGKKAFLAPISDIKKAMEYIEAAIQIEPRGIYYYLMAYIKYDFYERKSLNIYPGYRDELKRASQNNLTHEDIRILFELLGVSIPEGF
jgi:tetratricopeptide (TPR) repeat protein